MPGELSTFAQRYVAVPEGGLTDHPEKYTSQVPAPGQSIFAISGSYFALVVPLKFLKYTSVTLAVLG